MAINNQNINTPIVNENLKPTQVFFRFLASITSFVNNTPVILDGSGTPEGNVTAKFKTQYWDTLNSKLYFKSTATGNTGWVALN